MPEFRILSTHVGSLPRPDDLVDPLHAQAQGLPFDEPALERRIHEAVAESVRMQVASGVDLVNDGEMGKVSYYTYVAERLSGFEERVHVPRGHRPDSAMFPRYLAWEEAQLSSLVRLRRYACTGPVRYVGQAQLARDISSLKTALAGVDTAGAFMTAASPGVIAMLQPNRHYKSNEEYLWAVAEAMREEYEAIHEAGFILQLDCPDLTGMTSADRPGEPIADLPLRVEVLNHAVARIPAERMRMHICWGNYEGPHHLDVPLQAIIGEVLKARPAGLLLEGANPRHDHEWVVFERVRLPDGKTLIPGVVDSTTNYIEHPELVAQRLTRYAKVVGRDHIMAGTDCGFGTYAGMPTVHPDIVPAKLAAMAEGARIASRALA
jgi:5-methyltetrahydropteroyltriglutamate--homocysteine methyltransferase